jgi:hypothetical protein
LDGRDLYRHRLAADAIYRATYQRQLSRTLRVEWTAADQHGNRELQGLPGELVRLFSKRTDQIDAEVDQLTSDGRERTPRLVKWARPGHPQAERTGGPGHLVWTQKYGDLAPASSTACTACYATSSPAEYLSTCPRPRPPPCYAPSGPPPPPPPRPAYRPAAHRHPAPRKRHSTSTLTDDHGLRVLLESAANSPTSSTLGGVWAIFYGVSEIFAAFILREAGSRRSGSPADHYRFERPATLPRPAAG